MKIFRKIFFVITLVFLQALPHQLGYGGDNGEVKIDVGVEKSFYFSLAQFWISLKRGGAGVYQYAREQGAYLVQVLPVPRGTTCIRRYGPVGVIVMLTLASITVIALSAYTAYVYKECTIVACAGDEYFSCCDRSYNPTNVSYNDDSLCHKDLANNAFDVMCHDKPTCDGRWYCSNISTHGTIIRQRAERKEKDDYPSLPQDYRFPMCMLGLLIGGSGLFISIIAL